ncbi:MAG: hypothetical protein J6575_06610 [Bifidobacterium sp.]|nr:hypothetical protein [Bifidobacterium sp.]
MVVTLKNVDESATLSWSRTDPSGNTLLPGSEWRLDGPGGQSLDVADCTGDTAETCTGLDQDPAVGKFKLTGLKWGKWKITETKAPEGYRLSQPFSLTLGPDQGADGLSAFVAFHEGKPPVVPPSSGNGNGSGGNSGANGASSGANGNGALSETGSSVTQVAIVAVVTLLLGMALSAAIKRYSSKQDNA